MCDYIDDEYYFADNEHYFADNEQNDYIINILDENTNNDIIINIINYKPQKRYKRLFKKFRFICLFD